MSAPPTEEQPAWAPWSRAIVTLAVAAACLVGQRIPLPSIDFSEAIDSPLARTSVMVLGVRPLLTGFILVELLALIVPAWRPWRVGGPMTRAKLRRASLVVGMVLAVFQALVLALGLESFGPPGNSGLGFRFYTVIVLLGATATLALMARLVDEYGLGSGFSILILAMSIPGIIGALDNTFAVVRSGLINPKTLLTGALIAAGLVGATLWMFSGYRLPISAAPDRSSPLRLPACGIVPLSLVASLLEFVTRLTGVPADPLVLIVPFSLAVALLFSWLFNQPQQVAKVWEQLLPTAEPIKVQIKPAMMESAIYILLVTLGGVWLGQVLGYRNLPFPLMIVLATGIVTDLVSEWRSRCQQGELVPVWEIHRLYAVDPAVRLLNAQGITVFPQGVRHRTLLQFFGPFVPVRFLVEPAQAQRARELLQSCWPAQLNPPPVSDAPRLNPSLAESAAGPHH